MMMTKRKTRSSSDDEDDNSPLSQPLTRHKTCTKISSLNQYTDCGKIQTYSLHEDIVAEIFARLPVKSVFRLLCISKFWNSFISSKQFVKTNLELSKRNTNLARHIVITSTTNARGFTILKQCSVQSLFYEQITNATDLYRPYYQFIKHKSYSLKGVFYEPSTNAADCPTSNPIDHCSVVGCVNGLCCIVLRKKHIVLWNLSTREYRQLPDMNWTENTIFGFGLDDRSDDDYKVLGIGRLVKPYGQKWEYGMAMYTLKTGSWKIVQNMEDCSLYKSDGKFVCGKLHWLKNGKPHDIVSFDLRTEVMGLVDQPSNVLDDTFIPSLGEVGGNLCLVLYYPGIGTDFWVLKDYGIKESWIKVGTPKNISIITDRNITITPLCMSVEDEILFVCRSNFIIYNPKDEAFRFPRVHNFPKDHDYLKATVNIQSLVSPFIW